MIANGHRVSTPHLLGQGAMLDDYIGSYTMKYSTNTAAYEGEGMRTIRNLPNVTAFTSLVLLVLLALLFAYISGLKKADLRSVVYNIYLFNTYYDNLDIENFSLLEPPEDDMYLIQADSFSIDLDKQTITAKIKSIAHLPLPAATLDFESVAVSIPLKHGWHTVLVVEGYYGGAKENESYTTVYGLKDGSYQLMQPRARDQ